ncbi:AAA family ATPase [Streptomyces sp. NPDC057654]|uniref:ATP-binding protein n=1 Tax=Streptomyces sp. NPDC057654 TaxID=3346196 RepID=UPI003684F3D1
MTTTGPNSQAPLSTPDSQDLPPLPRRVPQQLLPALSVLSGRDDDLQRLDALADMESGATRVVVISGPPGVGATTLARHFLHRRRAEFTGGTLSADLGRHAFLSLVRPAEAEKIRHNPARRRVLETP